ncbi:kynureninase [alpha proteobacterium Q-1]|nr:kynureninase [alpha proteobacterium Q-1]
MSADRPASDFGPDLPTRAQIEAMDQADPLLLMRRRFDLPGGLIYLDGNSLGALPRGVAAHLGEVTRQQWGDRLIAGWSEGWMDLPLKTGALIAPLIGADEDEVIACDSTSINLFKLAAAALLARPDRSVILSEEGNFPTDLYMFDGLARLASLAGRPIHLRTVSADHLIDALDEDVALLALTHVNFRTARAHDMANLSAAAHQKGALCLWDLSHSVGAVAVDLHQSGADLAVGCGYKFLNGGPGAPAFLYVAKAMQNKLDNPLAGWMGHRDPFAFAPGYEPAPDIRRFACGTPPILGLSALHQALTLFSEVDLEALFEKGQALCDVFLSLIARHADLCVLSPTKRGARGCHVALAHPDARAITGRLAARGVVVDFRPPDIMRFGFAALYCRYIDAYDAAMILNSECCVSPQALADGGL